MKHPSPISTGQGPLVFTALTCISSIVQQFGNIHSLGGENIVLPEFIESRYINQHFQFIVAAGILLFLLARKRKRRRKGAREGGRDDLLIKPKNLGIKPVTSGKAGSTSSHTVNRDQFLGSSYEYKLKITGSTKLTLQT